MSRKIWSRHWSRKAAEQRLKELLAAGTLKPSDKAHVDVWLDGAWCVVTS